MQMNGSVRFAAKKKRAQVIVWTAGCVGRWVGPGATVKTLVPLPGVVATVLADILRQTVIV
jgi:hypothetical protein